MLYKLIGHNAADFVVAAKLAEEGYRGAASREAEIDGVAQVHGQRQTVNHHVEPLAAALPQGVLLSVAGEEYQQDVERIGVGNGRGVEQPSAKRNVPRLIVASKVGVEAVVLKEECHACDAIRHIQQEYVPHDGQWAGCYSAFYFHFLNRSWVMRSIYCCMMAFTSRSICCCSGIFPIRLCSMSESLRLYTALVC